VSFNATPDNSSHTGIIEEVADADLEVVHPSQLRLSNGPSQFPKSTALSIQIDTWLLHLCLVIHLALILLLSFSLLGFGLAAATGVCLIRTRLCESQSGHTRGAIIFLMKVGVCVQGFGDVDVCVCIWLLNCLRVCVSVSICSSGVSAYVCVCVRVRMRVCVRGCMCVHI